jgi:hypothetical protein
MYNECRHILPSGYKCKAAALKGKAFCYHHTLSRRPTNRGIAETGMLLLPSVEDAGGVTMGINQVLRQFGKGHIDGTQAGIFFRGLQIAASLVRKTSPDQRPGDTVREVCEDPIKGPIGPETTGCDPEDCVNCSKRYDCRDNQSRSDREQAQFRRDHLALAVEE